MSDAICLRDLVEIELQCRAIGSFDGANKMRNLADAVQRGQLDLGNAVGWGGAEAASRARMHEGSTHARGEALSFRRTHVPTGRVDFMTQWFPDESAFARELAEWNQDQPETWRYEPVTVPVAEVA